MASAKSFTLDSASRTEIFTIRNTGGPETILDWSITSKSERVTVTPSKGTLKGNDEDTVVIEVNQKGLSKGDKIRDTLLLSSDYGPKGIDLTFSMTASGFNACGAPAAGPTPTASGVSAPRFTPQQAPQTPYVPGELLVRYRTPVSLSAGEKQKLETLQLTSRAVARAFGLHPLRSGGLHAPDLVRVESKAALDVEAVDMEAVDMEALARRLEADPRVLYAEPNYYLHTRWKHAPTTSTSKTSGTCSTSACPKPGT